MLAGQTVKQLFRRKNFLQINVQFQNLFRLANDVCLNKMEEMLPIASAFVSSVQYDSHFTTTDITPDFLKQH